MRTISTDSGASLFLLIVLGLLPLSVHAQSPECLDLVQSKKAEVLRKLGGDVRLHRREDLEDNLIQISRRNSGNLTPPVFVYEVQDSRFTLVEGEILLNTCNDSCFRQQYVAMSQDGAKAYWLFGFEQPEVAFKELLTDIKATLGSRNSADILGSTCVELVAGIRPEHWVLS